MRIAIEATLAQRAQTGMGQYVLRLLPALAKIASKDDEFLLLHSDRQWTGPDFGPRFTPVSYFCHKQSLAIMLRLNSILRRERADIFHATCTTGAPPRACVPVISTIHDFFPLIHPEECSRAQAFFFKHLMKWTLRTSSRFITDSDFISAELQRYASVSPEKITTIHLAPSITCSVADLVRPGGGDCFLCVSAIDPRKGQLDLLKGYAAAAKEYPEIPNLSFVGPDRGLAGKLCSIINENDLTKKVSWDRYLDDDALKNKYITAKAFIFPSTYEGFGIPLLEAMSYGLPILCSDIPVFREIGGTYPIYVKPEPAEWAKAIAMFNAGAYAAHFAAISPKQELSRFSWEKCAKETLACYHELVN